MARENPVSGSDTSLAPWELGDVAEACDYQPPKKRSNCDKSLGETETAR